MTPDQLASVNAEHSHQRALFAWANIAERFGFDRAWDEETYLPGALARIVAMYDMPNVGTQQLPHVPELRWLHAIPNGGYRDAVTAGKLKAEGVKKGVCDMFLPLPLRKPLMLFMPSGSSNQVGVETEYCGLYVEMKRPKVEKEGKRKASIIAQAAGELSAEQTEFVEYARLHGYAVSVCFDWRSAASDIQKYIEACRNNR